MHTRTWLLSAAILLLLIPFVSISSLAAPSPANFVVPQIGNWQGVTNAGNKVTFSVSTDGTFVIQFDIFLQASCGTVAPSTGDNHLVITNDHFSNSDPVIHMTGQFTSTTVAGGTYYLPGSSSFCIYPAQSGTWTAQPQLPPSPTPTDTATTTPTDTATTTPTDTATPTPTFEIRSKNHMPIIFGPDKDFVPSPTYTPIETPTPTSTHTATPTYTPTDTPTSTATPTLFPVDGIWRGTTSYNQVIAFEIQARGIISLTTAYQNGGCGASVTLGGSPVPIIGNRFFYGVIPVGGPAIFANGIFNSAIAASGTISITGSSCGSFAGAWTATK